MPRSRHADRFNHDEDADDYDVDVQNEASPIRAGYAACLDQVAAWVADAPAGPILDLGAGTGNLSARLPADRELIAVDISARMLEHARDRLAGRLVRFVEDDLLAALDDLPPLAAVVSTYALHHLEPDEKDAALRRIGELLLPGGVLAVGDLGFADAADRRATLERMVAAGYTRTPEVVADEFFWDLADHLPVLKAWAGEVETVRFSDLTLAFVARCSSDPESER